jgi:predicted MFS family arabinose efflux permease
MDDTTGFAQTAAPPQPTPQQRAVTRRLLLFFALVYVVEGLGQIGGLVAQPLNYYLKAAQGWSPLQITAFITLFNIPWIIKPVYGLVSDFIPLFGYRRKSYLVIANIAAIIGYLWAATLEAPHELLLALMITAYAMAISSTLCGAVLVENGHELHESGTFVNQQWLWLNIATMVAAVLGGQLVERLPPGTALHTAALIVAVAPLAVVVASLTLVPEKKTKIDLKGFKDTFAGLSTSFKRRELWIVAGFMFLYYFSPGLSTPLYFHMTDELKYSQAYIGILGSISSAGWVVGALLYKKFLSEMPLRQLLQLSIASGTVTTLAFLLLGNEASAAVIYFCSGFSGMLATVSTLTLAADYSPPRAEGFTFAVLMSLINFANSAADNIRPYFPKEFAAAHRHLSGVHGLRLCADAATAPRPETARRTGAAEIRLELGRHAAR